MTMSTSLGSVAIDTAYQKAAPYQEQSQDDENYDDVSSNEGSCSYMYPPLSSGASVSGYSVTSTASTVVSLHIDIDAFERRLEAVLETEAAATITTTTAPIDISHISDEDDEDDDDAFLLEVYPTSENECSPMAATHKTTMPRPPSRHFLGQEEEEETDDESKQAATTTTTTNSNNILQDNHHHYPQEEDHFGAVLLMQQEEEQQKQLNGSKCHTDSTTTTPVSPAPTNNSNNKADDHSFVKQKSGVAGQSVSMASMDTMTVNETEEFKFKLGTALYGKSQELTQLQSILDRVVTAHSSEAVHLYGHCGVGKTALVMEALKDYTTYHYKGSFVTAKFDMLRFKAPHYAIFQAFSKLVETILYDSFRLDRVRQELVDQICPQDLNILVHAIPKLDLVIEKEHLYPRDDNDTDEQQLGDNYLPCHYGSFSRLKILCRSFLRAFASSLNVICLFLDDVQYADQDSKDLIKALCTDVESQNILIVCTCREAEYHKFRVDHKADFYLPCTPIRVGNLTQDELVDMLSSLLHSERDRTEPLAHALLSKTHGNVNHVIYMLRYLRDEEILYFCTEQKHWMWDLSRVTTSSSLDRLVRAKVNRLSQRTRNVLKLAACIGHTFETSLLVELCKREFANNNNCNHICLVHCALEEATLHGLVVENCNNEHRFSQNYIQMYCYKLIESGMYKELLHRRVGDAVLNIYNNTDNNNNTDGDNNKHNGTILLLLAVDHLNLGSRQLSANPAEVSELVRLNLEAAQRCMIHSAYRQAYKFLKTGIHHLGCGKSKLAWKKNHDLAADLYKTLCRVEAALGNFEESHDTYKVILSQSKRDLDKLESSFTMIETLIARDLRKEAFTLCLDVLRDHGRIVIPTRPNSFSIKIETQKTRRLTRNLDDVLDLPIAGDPLVIACMRLLSTVANLALCLENQYGIFCLATYRLVQLTYSKGLSSHSAFGFTCLSVLSHVNGPTLEIKFANAGSRISHYCCQNNHNSSSCGGGGGGDKSHIDPCTMFHHFLAHSLRPLGEIADGYEGCANINFQGGNVPMAFEGVSSCVTAALYSGKTLDQVLQRCTLACNLMRDFGHSHDYKHVLPVWQLVLCLQGEATNESVLDGDVMNFKELKKMMIAEQDLSGLRHMALAQIVLAHTFEQWAHAEKLIPLLGGRDKLQKHHWLHSIETFFRAMCYFAFYHRTEKGEYRSKANKMVSKIQKIKERGIIDCNAKHCILLAEKSAIAGRHGEAIHLLDKASQESLRVGNLFETALANERAASMLINQGKIRNAHGYLVRARDLYQQYGARAKVRWLEETYPNVLLM